jgi:DNA primase
VYSKQEREDIDAACRVPIPSLLPKETPLIKKSDGKYMALCQFHDETTPSMSLVQYPDGKWGYRCFGCGATGDPIKYVQATKGLDFFDSVKELVQAAKTAPVKPHIVATYDYLDEQSHLLYQVVRYEPKNFRIRRPSDQGWQWCLKDMRRVLYKLPQLMARPDSVIFYTEGEADVETLTERGLLATTHAGGANSFRDELLGPLAGRRRIVVVPDRDEPGMALMRRVFAAGRKMGHDMGFLILPRHKDPRDWFNSGESMEEFMGLVR